jgi:hypothetical protein
MAARFWRSKRRWTSTSSPQYLPPNGGVATRAVAPLELSFPTTPGAHPGSELGASALPATLRHLVSDVVSVRPNKEVVRVYADRVVAFVQNVQRLWDRAIGEFVTDSMWRGALAVEPELPVGGRFAASGLAKPRPTFVGGPSMDLRPESIDVCLLHAPNVPNPRGGI